MTQQPERPASNPPESPAVMLTVGGRGIEDLVADGARLSLLRDMLGGIGLIPTVVRVRDFETWRPSYDYTDMSGLSVEEVLDLHRNIFDSPIANEQDAEAYEALSGPFINGLSILPHLAPAKAIAVFEALTANDSSPEQRYIAALTISKLPVADPTAALKIWERLLRDQTSEPEMPHEFAADSIDGGLEGGTISAWQALHLRRVHAQAHPEV